MKNDAIVKKWCLLVIQGVLLIILSFFIFQRPFTELSGITGILGFLILAAGASEFIGFFLAEKEERTWIYFLTGFFTIVLSITMLLKTGWLMKITGRLLLLFMILHAVTLLQVIRDLYPDVPWWFSIAWLLYTTGTVYLCLRGYGFWNTDLSLFAGFQFFLSGVTLIIFSLVLKKSQAEQQMTISELINRNPD